MYIRSILLFFHVPLLERKPGALRNGAPFKALELHPALAQIRTQLSIYTDGGKQFIKILLEAPIKTIKEFDFKNVPLKPEQFHKLSECDFIKEKLNLLLIGSSGTGETHLALNLAYAALVKNYRIRFYSLGFFINQNN